MRYIIVLALFLAVAKAMHVQVNDVKDAHVNVQLAHDTKGQSPVSMHGGQTAHSPESSQKDSHDNDHIPQKFRLREKESTSGTLNYHKAKKQFHKAALQKYKDIDHDQLVRTGVGSHEDQDPRTQELKLKIMEHKGKLTKQYALIHDLKTGVKVPGTKNVDHLRARNKLAPGYS